MFKKPALLIICGALVVFGIFLSPDHTRAGSIAEEFSSVDSVLMVDGAPAGSLPIRYTGFTVTFNPTTHEPDFVAWQLTDSMVNTQVVTRKEAHFAPDADIDGCPTLADYRNSGYDRGHMAPAADMRWSQQAMTDCHYLTNMCPQDKRLNTGAWNTVEQLSRRWVANHGPLYIVAGPVPGDYITRYIGENKLPVPERFFKVIIAPHSAPPLGIGFVMPNGAVENGAQSCVTSIDNVEEITGYDFFYWLPDELENEIEAQSAMNAWNH